MRKRARRVGAPISVAVAIAAIVVGFAVAGPAARARNRDGATGCHLGNGVPHVIEITFDNVHFNRDNPNVLSDLEQMPALKNFITGNGTLLSNNHTPLIAHTADDTLTTSPASTATARARASRTTTRPTARRRRSRRSRRSPTGPARTGSTRSRTCPTRRRFPQPDPRPRRRPRRGCRSPAPAATSATSRPRTWSSRTSTPISRTSSAPNSPEVQQLQRRDPDSYKDQEVADYEGLAVHCAQGERSARRGGGQVRADARRHGGDRRAPRRAGRLQRLPGRLRAQVPRSRSSRAPPTRAACARRRAQLPGDRRRRQPRRPERQGDRRRSTSHTPGSPASGRSPPRSRWPTSPTCRRPASPSPTPTSPTRTSPSPVRPGARTPAARHRARAIPATGRPSPPTTRRSRRSSSVSRTTGSTPANTLFVFSSDEGDHFAGANVGRAVDPVAAPARPTPRLQLHAIRRATIGEQEVRHPRSASIANSATGRRSTTSRRATPSTSPATRARQHHDPAARARLRRRPGGRRLRRRGRERRSVRGGPDSGTVAALRRTPIRTGRRRSRCSRSPTST